MWLEISKSGFVQQMIHNVFPLSFICTVSHVPVVELCKILPHAIFVSDATSVYQKYVTPRFTSM